MTAHQPQSASCFLVSQVRRTGAFLVFFSSVILKGFVAEGRPVTERRWLIGWKRFFFSCVVLVALEGAGTAAWGQTAGFAYVANQGSTSISAYSIDGTTGALAQVSIPPVSTGSEPASLTVDPTGRFLYLANHGSIINNVFAYRINGSNGALISDVPGSPFTAGWLPISVTVDPTGRFVYVANSLSNDVSAFTIGATGALTSIGSFPTGTSPASVTVDPKDKFVYVANSGSNSVSAFGIAATGALNSLGSVPAGTFPASVTVEPKGKFVYVANSNSNNISVYAIGVTGALTPMGSAVPAGGNPVSITADPTGNFVYAAGRGNGGGGILAYAIDQATGALTLVPGSTFLAGLDTWAVTAGRFVYAVNRGSNDVSAYSINGTTGALTSVVGSPFPAELAPVSVTTTAGPSGSLIFPIKDPAGRSLSPFATPISSVADHNRGYGIIVSYAGERGRRFDGTAQDQGLDGFSASTLQSVFLVNGKYNGDIAHGEKYIFYETGNYQHPGYDYPVTGTVVAPTNGTLWIVASDPINGQLGATSAWCRFHTFRLVHDDLSESWFLHTQRFLNAGESGAVQNLDAMARAAVGDDAYACNSGTVIDIDTQFATVGAGEAVAIIGDTGVAGHTHLHHEERNGLCSNSDGSDCLVDPFGWEGFDPDPLTSNPGSLLWQGYVRPTVSSATIDSQSLTLDIVGANLLQAIGATSIELWRFLDENVTGANPNDGTRVEVLSILPGGTATEIKARVTQDVVAKASSYTAKVALQNGPRSVAVPLLVQ